MGRLALTIALHMSFGEGLILSLSKDEAVLTGVSKRPEPSPQLQRHLVDDLFHLCGVLAHVVAGQPAGGAHVDA